MTNATPHTRLMLLTWIERFELQIKFNDREGLAKEMGMSKHLMGAAIDYLVREGYLWKMRNSYKAAPEGKYDLRFEYGLTQESRQLWHKTRGACVIPNELSYVLCCVGLGNLTLSDKPVVITANMILVWISLILKANQSGYIVGFDSQVAGKTLGMTEVTFRKNIRLLIQVGYILNLSNGVRSTKLYDYLSPIYKINFQQSDCKIVKLGVTLSDGFIGVLRFIKKLQIFYSKTSKSGKIIRYAPNDSMLEDEQYFELSKVFSNKKLAKFVQQLCLWIVFSTVPEYDSVTGGPLTSSQDGASKASCEYLNLFVRQKLEEGLTNVRMFDSVVCRQNESNDFLSDDVVLLKYYTLDTLSRELVGVIEQLAKQWKVFSAIFGERVKLTGYLPGYIMLAPIPKTKGLGSKTACKGEAGEDIINSEYSKNQSSELWTSNVLTVHVPDNDKYYDCMVLGDELLTANSRVDDSKME